MCELVDHRLGDEAHAVGGEAESAGIGFGILPDDEAIGNLYAAINDDALQPRIPSDPDEGQNHRFFEIAVGVDPDPGRQQRAPDPGT